MNSFKKRISKGQELQDYLINYLDKNEISYFLTGYEGLSENNNAKLKIIKNNSRTSLFVRHYPDITLVSNQDTYLLEIKNSSGIEKKSWETYKKLHNELGVNILFLLKTKLIYNIRDIVFNKMNTYDSVAKINIPITDKIWKEPRKLPDNQYLNYLKAYNNKTSGCSFAFIDFKKSKGYSVEVLKKLNNP